jgi:hypothetical protein
MKTEIIFLLLSKRFCGGINVSDAAAFFYDSLRKMNRHCFAHGLLRPFTNLAL